ncbi:MAG TPA: class I SAM-dependent methyltransferase [Acidimicrobiales bacterium]|nr:class I SAM-dependent methyltransferase [Acidimicrobiales bacterium]
MADNIGGLGTLVSAYATGRPNIRLLDLGCWDGRTTLSYLPAGACGFGVEVSTEAASRASGLGLCTVSADLNRGLPFRSDEFDVVTSNQVIEHLSDTDQVMAEAHRVLRPGGLVVISTENLASWHNIGALLFGWQAFSLTNVSRYRPGVGNPLANLRHDEPPDIGWQHTRIFSYRGLRELAEAVGFVDIGILASGYYPFPSRMARIDPRHGAFITVTGRKVNGQR